MGEAVDHGLKTPAFVYNYNQNKVRENDLLDFKLQSRRR